MSYRLRSAREAEIEQWDKLLLKNPDGGNSFQSRSLAEVKSRYGWEPRFCVYDGDAPIATCFLVRKVAFLGELWYAPKGPSVANAEQLESVLAANQIFASIRPKIFCFKIEPEITTTKALPATLVKADDVQPNANTILIDLSPSEADILASFRQRARRAIRKAEAAKIEVEAVESTPENCKIMYDLYTQTAERAGFEARDLKYYQLFWQTFAQAKTGQLFLAYLDDRPVAGVFVTYLGKHAVYKDGASSRESQAASAPYLLQWQVMRWLKKQGVTSYDLHSSPPAGQLTDKSHPFYSLGLFKTSFNPEVTEFIGTYDQVVQPSAYNRWRYMGEKLLFTFEKYSRHRTLY